MSHTRAKFMVDLISIEIIVVFDNFPSSIVKLIVIFGLIILKINLNTVLETSILGVQCSRLIDPVYH